MIRLARVSVRRPVLAILAWTVVAAALTLVGLGVASSISPTVTTVAGTQSSRAELARSQFGPSVLVPILLEGPGARLDHQGPALVRALAARRTAFAGPLMPLMAELADLLAAVQATP